MYSDLIPHVKPQHFHHVASVLREVFTSLGYLEVHPQNRLSILAACEDPHTIATFNYAGELWPLPQTNQMWLEFELLKNPDLPGIFCLTTSYRNEPTPVLGRHHLAFPMFEFEGRGNFEDLLKIEEQIISAFGYSTDNTKSVSYQEACDKYDVTVLKDIHEKELCTEEQPVVFLYDFPEHTNPFWNMERNGDVAKKADVLMAGMETIGSAERSSDPTQMLSSFAAIENGKYSDKLFGLFGEKRVMDELNDFLKLSFFPRFGGGIGLTRLIRALNIAGRLSE